MDKLRALNYFVAAAEEGSLSAAARRFDVSVPAVAKLVSALERELGVKLLDRSTQGLVLTARGAQYLEQCNPLLAQLADADRAITSPGLRRARTLVVGAPPLLSRAVLVPGLADWHQRHPHVHIDLRTLDFLTVKDSTTRGVDVLVDAGLKPAKLVKINGAARACLGRAGHRTPREGHQTDRSWVRISRSFAVG